ncbi:MAG: LysM peptidoglycan-binding domain-containing protein [bacterium]
MKMKGPNGMNFKFSYFFYIICIIFLATGCAPQTGIMPSQHRGIEHADYLEKDSALYLEDFEIDYSTHERRRLLLSQDSDFEPLESDDSFPPIDTHKHGDLLSDSSTASFWGGNGSLISEEPVQDKLDDALVLCQDALEGWKEGNVEMAIELLDRAYEVLINIETNDDEIFQQKEDIRFLISKRIVEIYASRQNTVNGKHNEIPLIMNPVVEREIKSFLGPERKFFLESYIRSGKYRPMILEELRKAGLPVRLSWLPLIESGFLVRALSRSRALGLWQFIPSTGYKFGLKRNHWIDERMDPVKSTRAAIEYLTQLHHTFGDWTTVLAAYNCGEGRVLRVIRDQHINYLDNFWDLYSNLPSETARYVPRLMAALHLIENPEKYGLELPPLENSLAFKEITVNKQVQLSDLAHKIGISPRELALMNPELRHKVTPDSEYLLKVPFDKEEIAFAQLETIPAWQPPKPEFVYHRIRKGETLSHIAKQYGTSIKNIAKANNIRRYNWLTIGRRLKIPIQRRSLTFLADTGSTNGLKTVSVQKGDCAYTIARMHGMGLDEFLSINNLTQGSVIYPGQRLLVKIH